ncbi:MAG: LysR family transcriptional regulator [Herpetosiphon sp.]
MLDLGRLRIFIAIAAAGTLTGAAARLGLRQPTVTQQLHVLEQELQAPLFHRLPRGVTLTPVGVALLPYARNLLALAEEAVSAAAQAAGIADHTVKLGAGNTLATYILPDLLARLRWEQPAMTVTVTVGNTAQLTTALLAGEVELALVGSPLIDQRLSIEPLLTNELVAIVPPDDPLAAATTVDLADLADRSMLMREPGSALHAAVMALLAACSLQPRHTLILGNLEAIKRCVEAGIGVAVVPELSIRREAAAGSLVVLHLRGHRSERNFVFAYRKDQPLGPAARIFRALLLKPFE